MTISINIHCDTSEEALGELRELANALVEVAGPAPEQRELHYGPHTHVSGSATQTGTVGGKAENTGTGEVNPIRSVLDNTIKTIKAELPKMSVDELRDLADYEDDGKGRATLLKAINDEINSRNAPDGDGADDGAAETTKPSEAKANTGLDDDDEQSDDTGLAGEAEQQAKAAEKQAEMTAEPEAPAADEPTLEDCREIGRKVQRLENGTEMLRQMLVDIGAEDAKLSTAHTNGKGAAFVAGCKKILAEKGE